MKQGICFIKAVLLLCQHGSHGQFDPTPPNTIRGNRDIFQERTDKGFNLAQKRMGGFAPG